MLKTLPLDLGKASNPGRYAGAGSLRHINCYLEQGGEGAKADPLYPSAGLNLFSAAAGGGVRAMLPTSNALYVVRGRLLHKIDASGSSTVLGGIPTDGFVGMARNRREPDPEVGIVSDGLYWVVVNNTMTQVSDVDLPPASSIAVLDGYFILPGYGSNWHITAVDDASSIDALDFASAESQPDANVRVATRETEVVFFGADSVEWWQNSGGEFPFTRVQTARIGCLAAASVAEVDRTLMWVAHDGTVRLMQGYDGKRVSSHAVERAIQDDTDRASIVATSWHQDGHIWYVISGTDWTWQYDLTTGFWHERQSYDSSKWRISHVTEFAGKTIAGDATTGALYEMSRDYFDEAGNPLVFTVDTQIIHTFPDRLQISTVYADVIAGQGLVPGDTTTNDPKIMLAMSRDGGRTFGPERMASMGISGARKTRVLARRWGMVSTAGAVFRLSASAAVARGVLGAAVEAERLRA